MSIDILKIMLQSGLVVKLVLLLFLIASIYSWALILRKYKYMRDVANNNKKFLTIYRQASNLKAVVSQLTDFPFCPLHTVFTEGYNELSKIRSSADRGEAGKEDLSNHFKTYGLGLLERALRKGRTDSNLKLDEGLPILATIGSVSPFVGLFGTVWGIIDSFTGLSKGGATLDAVAPGIAEALVATAIGLAVAIPAVWFYNHFTNANTRMISEAESFSEEFINVVERSLLSGK